MCYVDLQVDGTSRTQLDSFQGYSCGSALPGNATELRYVICKVTEEIGGVLDVAGPFSASETASCDTKVAVDHPALHFFVPDLLSTQLYAPGVLQFLRVAGQQDAFYLSQRSACSGAIQKGHAFIGVTAAGSSSVYYKLDVRRVLVTNTQHSPADVNSSNAEGACPAVQKNFINAESCVHREPSRSCSSSTFASASLTLDRDTLRSWFADSSKYVYYVRNLTSDGGCGPTLHGGQLLQVGAQCWGVLCSSSSSSSSRSHHLGQCHTADCDCSVEKSWGWIRRRQPQHPRCASGELF